MCESITLAIEHFKRSVSRMRDVRTAAGMMMSFRKLESPFSGWGYSKLRIYRHNVIIVCIFASFSTDTILWDGDAEETDDEEADEVEDVDGEDEDEGEVEETDDEEDEGGKDEVINNLSMLGMTSIEVGSGAK